jgi:hypothetical protein
MPNSDIYSIILIIMQMWTHEIAKKDSGIYWHDSYMHDFYPVCGFANYPDGKLHQAGGSIHPE